MGQKVDCENQKRHYEAQNSNEGSVSMNYLATTVSEYVNNVASLWNQKQTPTRDPKPKKKNFVFSEHDDMDVLAKGLAFPT